MDIIGALDEIFEEDERLPPSEAHGFRLVPGDDLTDMYLLTEIPGAAAFSVFVATPGEAVAPAMLVAPGEWLSEFHQVAEHETAWALDAGVQSLFEFRVERPGAPTLEFTLGFGI